MPRGRAGWSVGMATAGSERGLSLRSPARYTEAADRLLQLYAARGGPAASADAVAQAHMDAEASKLHTYWTASHVARATPSAPRPAATRSSGPRPTSPSTPPPSTCSAPKPSVEAGAPGDWLDGYLFSWRGPSTPGPTRFSATCGRAPARAAAGLIMDFAFTDEQEALRDGVRTVLDTVRPGRAACLRTGRRVARVEQSRTVGRSSPSWARRHSWCPRPPTGWG